MKVHLDRPIAYFDVRPDFTIKLGALFRLFQEAAVAHSEQVGFGSRELVESKTVWILNKIGARIYRYPAYGETVTVTTWSRGARGFKAFRDFTLQSGTQTVAAATSLWLYYDMRRGRLVRVPQPSMDTFTVETETARDFDVDAWKSETEFDPEKEASVTVRFGDFDPLGHVNNSRYVDYVETFLFRTCAGCGAPAALNIQFLKEIGAGIATVRVEGTEDGRSFRIVSRKGVHAAGDLRFPPGG